MKCIWDSVVSTAAGYRMDGSGFEPRWRQEVFSRSVQAFPGAYSASYTNSTGALSLGVNRLDFRLDHPLPSSAETNCEYSYTSTLLCAYIGVLRGDLYLYLWNMNLIHDNSGLP